MKNRETSFTFISYTFILLDASNIDYIRANASTTVEMNILEACQK